MSCFWDGILKAFNSNGWRFNSKKEFIEFLKKENRKTRSIIWNNNPLREQEMSENFEAVKNYDIKYIYNGHLCSCCDYILLLVSEIFCVDIDHWYLNRLMSYKNKKGKKKLTFHSNHHHFWN